MAYRWHPKNAEVDPDNPKAWGSCDRCGMIWQLDQLTWQYAYQGSSFPINTNFLVCPKHLDPLNPQDMPYVLPPDPPPVYNARPEPYLLDEASYLTTQDGSILTTQDGTYLGTAIPNPEAVAATAHLESSIVASGGSVATAYLDIFNGNPLTTGASVLALITGSTTRTNIASQLTTTRGVATNTDTIVVALEAASTTNVSYCAIYNSASAGTLLMSGPLNVNGPNVTVGNPVVFSALGLSINLN